MIFLLLCSQSLASGTMKYHYRGNSWNAIGKYAQSKHCLAFVPPQLGFLGPYRLASNRIICLPIQVLKWDWHFIEIANIQLSLLANQMLNSHLPKSPRQDCKFRWLNQNQFTTKIS